MYSAFTFSASTEDQLILCLADIHTRSPRLVASSLAGNIRDSQQP